MSAPIVVPTDFSPASAEALAYALLMARAVDARVHILHAVSWPDAGPFEVPGEAPTASQEATEELALARAALAEFVGGARDDVDLVVRQSNVPAFEVVDHARRVGAGLVVMAACSRRARPGLGAVTDEVVQTAPCDVLLVPYSEARRYSAGHPRRVLVPVDFSSASRPLIEFAAKLARDLGAGGLDLVHVLAPLPHPVRWLDETIVDLVPEIRQRAADALRELAEGAVGEGDLDVELYVERGKPARTLVRTAEALGSDLIVLGAHAERPVFDRLLGSVAEGVARRARCPVLIARRSATPGAHVEAPVDPWSYEPEPA